MSDRAADLSVRAPTRADVARHAKVSTAVVSYVVNGTRNVAPHTAARVREAIEVLGYRPNVSARALRTGTTEMLGLVLSDTSNPYFAEFGREIEIAAAERGHALITANSHGDGTVEQRLIADLVGPRVDGLIVGSIWGRPDLRLAEPPGVRTVWIDCPGAVPGYASLGTDSVHGARQAVHHLIEVHGHRLVGLATGETDHIAADPRERGWRAALGEAGLPDGPIARGGWTREGGLDVGRRLFSAANPPSAVFAASDLIAMGVLRAAHERGLRVPEDVAVLSFDGTAESAYSWPPLTAVHQPVPEMAQAAVATVLDPGAPSTFRRFEAELVVRSSCGCHPSTPQATTEAPRVGAGALQSP